MMPIRIAEVGRNKSAPADVSGKTTGQVPETVVARPYSGLQLDLSLNEEKTRIADFHSGLDFLGVHFVEPTNGGPLLATSPHPALLPANRLETVMHENEALPEEETGLPNDKAETVQQLLRSQVSPSTGSIVPAGSTSLGLFSCLLRWSCCISLRLNQHACP
jgi:hypothetical protein